MVQHDLPDGLRIIGEAGYEGVEASWLRIRSALSESDDMAGDLRRLLSDAGLVLSSLNLTNLSAESPDDLVGNLEAIRAQMQFARQLGLRSVNLEAGDRRAQPPELLVSGLRQLASVAHDLGLKLNIGNRLGSRIEQIEDLRYVFAHLRADNVRLLFDLGQFHSAAVIPFGVLIEFGHRLGLVRLRDQIGHTPVPLGQGEANLPALLEVIRKTGYRDWFVVEARAEDDHDTPRHLRDAITYLQRLVERTSKEGEEFESR